MKIPEHLNKPLLEQLSDQADSDDYLVMRGSALGYALLNEDEKRDEFIHKFVESHEPFSSSQALGGSCCTNPIPQWLSRLGCVLA